MTSRARAAYVVGDGRKVSDAGEWPRKMPGETICNGPCRLMSASTSTAVDDGEMGTVMVWVGG